MSQLDWDTAELEELRKTTPERHESLELCNPYDLEDDVGQNPWLPEDIFPGFRSFYNTWWDADRYSLAFFGMPDPDVIIETLPGCETKGKWAQNMVGEWGETVSAGEWLAKRVSTEFPADDS